MSRPPRIDFPDAVYHVTSRGNGRSVIFTSDDDRQRFLAQLAENLHVGGVVLYAYVLMDNHASRYAIGETAFVERIENRIESQRTGRAQDQDLALPRWTVPVEEIDEAVARHYGIAVGRLQAHGRSAGAAKITAVALACRLTGSTGQAIGAHYGGISSAAVSTIQRKVRNAGAEAVAIESLLGSLTGRRQRRPKT